MYAVKLLKPVVQREILLTCHHTIFYDFVGGIL